LYADSRVSDSSAPIFLLQGDQCLVNAKKADKPEARPRMLAFRKADNPGFTSTRP
jgi:hypothetical protein